MLKLILSISFCVIFSIPGHGQKNSNKKNNPNLTTKQENGLYGFFYKETQVLDFQYDSIVMHWDSSYFVRKTRKWGLVSQKGKEIIPCKYETLHSARKYIYTATYDGYMGLLDTIGTVILDFIYDDIDHVDAFDKALLKYQGRWAYFNKGILDYNPDSLIFSSPDTVASFPGCNRNGVTYDEYKHCSEEKLYLYIYEHINYPVVARRKGIKGIVIVSFVVTSTGEIKYPVMRRGIGGGCDEEVLRVVSGMPNWKPGFKEGKEVNTLFTLPVKFVLQ